MTLLLYYDAVQQKNPNEFWKNLWARSNRIKKELLLVSKYSSVDGCEYPSTYSEIVGTFSSVQGVPYLKGFNVTHTHLTSHPPSVADYLHEIQSRAAYDTLYHRVVTTCHIWHYSASSALMKCVNGLIEECNHTKLAELFSSLSDRLYHANKEYIKNGDCSLYIRELKDIGFNVSVFEPS